MTRNHRQNDHAAFDNHPRKGTERPPSRTLGNLRRGVTNAVWTASWRIQELWGWIGFVVLVLATLTALVFAGYVLLTLLN